MNFSFLFIINMLQLLLFTRNDQVNGSTPLGGSIIKTGTWLDIASACFCMKSPLATFFLPHNI